MRIGVVSDTHSRPLPKQLLNDFKSVDYIIHAGDFCELADYEALAKIKEVKAVQGNMDGAVICKRFPRRQILKCGAFTIGLFHGEGSRKNIMETVKNEFKNDKVDAVIFGHSHAACNEKIGSVLYFNPGSATDDASAEDRSYGILEVSEKGIMGTIIKVKG